MGADAVVLVNSTSPNYLDFQHHLQPYLDNFGIPYTVWDIAISALDTNLAHYAVILIGHSQVDTQGTYLSANAQQFLTSAVTNGTGLVSFDGALASGTTPRYAFVQSIFGFSYSTAGSGASVSLPATELGSQMHFITSRHTAGEVIGFRASMSVPGLSVPTNVTAVALSAGHPLVAVTKFGLGRAVQWSSYDWMATSILGPLEGLDDLLWRSIVWAARKPFVMRSLPNFVTFRVDDVSGDSGSSPFWWVRTANSLGFKPWLSLFLSSINETKAADLRSLVTNGLATTSIHSFDCCSTFFYWNWGAKAPYSDTVMSNNFYTGTQWHLSHGIPISKVMVPHYNDIGANAFAGLAAWGVEYPMLYQAPGTPAGSPWLPLGPYRLYETPQNSGDSLPLAYADFVSIPGHPEFNGQFFDCFTEIRDEASCGEWCPADNDVAGSIGRGSRQLKRALDSLVLPTLFTHEWYFVYIPQKGLTISPGNWQAILQGITNNLASYHPSYATLDYACQYVRAKRTSRVLSSAYEPDTGQVTASFSGKTDLDTLVYTYLGEDASITNLTGTVPAFAQPQTVPVAQLIPMPVSVMLTNPADGAGLTSPVDVVLAVSASSSSGTITNVEFFNGATSLGQVGAPPYTLTWSNVPPGAYTLAARASNSLGDLAVSPAVHLTVSEAAPPSAIAINGAQTYQTIEGFGINANHRSWTNNELQPVIDALIDQAGMTQFRVLYDKTDWEAVNVYNANPTNINWAYYNGVYSSWDFEALWGLLSYLDQRGMSNGLSLNFQGSGPSWMSGTSLKPGYEDQWAEMIASLLIYARNTRHLQFHMVAPANEPDNTDPRLQGIYMTLSQYLTAMHDLAVSLDANGLSDMRFAGPSLGLHEYQLALGHDERAHPHGQIGVFQPSQLFGRRRRLNRHLDFLKQSPIPTPSFG